MRKKLLATCLVLTLGILGLCHASDAKIQANEAVEHQKPIHLKDIFTVGKSVSPSVGYLYFSTSGTIHFLKAYFYDSNTSDCTGTLTLLGAVSVVDNGAGFPFSNGQTVSFNGDAAYALIQNAGQGITDSSVKCMKFYLGGGNDTSNTTNCVSLPENCSPSTCTTPNTTAQGITWDSSNGVCTASPAPTVAPYFYVVDRAYPAVVKCSFTNETTLACVDTTPVGVTFSNTYDIAIDNSYAYVTTYISGSPDVGNVYKCIVSAADGSLSSCTTLQISSVVNNQYGGIALSGGYIYVGNGLSGSSIVNYTGVSATDGSFSTTSNGVSASFPYGVTLNNAIAYVQRTSSIMSYYTVSSVDGSLTYVNDSTNTSFPTGNVATREAPDGSRDVAYFTVSSDSTLHFCTNTSGVFSACGSITLTGVTGILGIQNVIIYNGYAYVSAFSAGGGQIIACSLNSDGSISIGNCQIATVSGFSLGSPYGMYVY